MNEPPTEAETTVRYTYLLSAVDSGIYAECVELDAAGEGKTREEAVEALREALRGILGAAEAVAPPAAATSHHVVLIEATAPQRPSRD
jgi:predicted RNase H-like HicB family nuclease